MSKKRHQKLLKQVGQLSESERQTLLDRLKAPHSGLELDEKGIIEIMSGLSCLRPIFHSEADFQHALAWQIHKFILNCGVRLEYKPFPEERKYVDLWLSLSRIRVALELKYPTQELNCCEAAEAFSLRPHSARDHRRYDFLKDIERLEKISRRENVFHGFAIMLTNDSAYWKPGSKNANDAAFHLCDGRQICGKLAWKNKAGRGTTQKREAPIQLNESYKLCWREYRVAGKGKHSEFRYLLVHVHG